MAVVLLDSIINDTIHNFRGHGLLENSLGTIATTATSASISNQMDNLTTTTGDPTSPSHRHQTAGPLDHLDSLTSLMQDVEMGQKERIFWVLLFSLMVLIAAVNLSLADTMVSTLNVIFNFISMLNSNWPFGNIYCKISNFIAILSISASVFTLTAISCDRYNAIIHPLRPRMSHKHAIGWILLIWTLSSLLAMPNLIYSLVVEDRLINENLALTCTMIWPDGRYPLSSYDHIYNIVILVVTYLVPILTMAILYYEVGKELWGYEAIGENVDKQRRAIMAKKKIVKMMIVVVIMFALCWLPYHGFFVLNYYLPTIFQDGPLLYQRCYLIIYWLAMSNSMYEPIIIYFMNSNFRHEFRAVLWLVCCCRPYTRPAKASDGHPNRSQSTSYHQQQQGENHRRQQPRSRTMITNLSKADRPTRQTFRAQQCSSSNGGHPIEVIISKPDEGHLKEDEDRPFLAHSNNFNFEDLVHNQQQPEDLKESEPNGSHLDNKTNNNNNNKDHQKVWI